MILTVTSQKNKCMCLWVCTERKKINVKIFKMVNCRKYIQEFFCLIVEICMFGIISKYTGCYPTLFLVSPSSCQTQNPPPLNMAVSATLFTSVRVQVQQELSTIRHQRPELTFSKTQHIRQEVHQVLITECISYRLRMRKLSSNLLMMDITFEYYLSNFLYYILFQKGRKKEQTDFSNGRHIIEFHRVAFLEVRIVIQEWPIQYHRN